MAKKDNNFYFDTFAKGIYYAYDAAVLLQNYFNDFNTADIKAKIDEMHSIEHSADEVKHEMMRKLMKEFLPPIEREDIVSLAQNLDDITDTIEDVFLRIYICDIDTVKQVFIEDY